MAIWDAEVGGGSPMSVSLAALAPATRPRVGLHQQICVACRHSRCWCWPARSADVCSEMAGSRLAVPVMAALPTQVRNVSPRTVVFASRLTVPVWTTHSLLDGPQVGGFSRPEARLAAAAGLGRRNAQHVKVCVISSRNIAVLNYH